MAATGKLNSNEPRLSENLKNITEEDLEMLSSAMEEITDGVANEINAAAGSESGEESEA